MRLTTRTEDGRTIIRLYTSPQDVKGLIDESARKNREAIEKLARYEDMNEPDPKTGLKPCPFCGGNGKLFASGTGFSKWAECTNCKANVGAFPSVKEAIEAWNRRATDDKSAD